MRQLESGAARLAFGEQDLTAVFGEIIVPVVKGLEISGALRYDKYGKAGDFSKTSPKFGVRYQPVRNLLLTLSGGVALAFAGQGAAHAQDAASASDGAGAANSGDATATGNIANSSTLQGTDGSATVSSQSGTIGNTGIAVADTGRNVAVGNSSGNTATVAAPSHFTGTSGRRRGALGVSGTSSGGCALSSSNSARSSSAFNPRTVAYLRRCPRANTGAPRLVKRPASSAAIVCSSTCRSSAT